MVQARFAEAAPLETSPGAPGVPACCTAVDSMLRHLCPGMEAAAWRAGDARRARTWTTPGRLRACGSRPCARRCLEYAPLVGERCSSR